MALSCMLWLLYGLMIPGLEEESGDVSESWPEAAGRVTVQRWPHGLHLQKHRFWVAEVLCWVICGDIPEQSIFLKACQFQLERRACFKISSIFIPHNWSLY